MSELKIIGTIEKSKLTQVRVQIQTWEDRPYVHVRTYVRDEGEEEYKPTKKGVALSLKQGLELCDVVDKLREALKNGNGEA